MRVLVTGAAGAVGSALVPAVRELGHEVTAVDRRPFEAPAASRIVVGDLQDRTVVLDALDGVDRVAHMGAIPSPRGFPDDEIFASNTRSSYLVLDEAGRLGVDRAVVASSLAALGIAWADKDLDPVYLPADEFHPILAADPYGLSKVVVEDIGAMVNRRWGIDVALLRFPFIGSGERLAGHLREFAENPRAARRELFGWIHLDDVVRSVVMGLFEDWSGCHVLNVAAPDTGSTLPTSELLERFYPGIHVRGRLDGHASLYSSSRVKRLYGFEARYDWRVAAQG